MTAASGLMPPWPRRLWIRRAAALAVATVVLGPLVPVAMTAPPAQAVASPPRAADTGAALVTEFDVNGLKVLLKRRAGSQTVAAGLYLRGGARLLTAETAGVESMMLDVATQATTGFPRDALRRELAATGTSLGSGANYDYSVLSLASTRRHFDRAWAVFADVVLRPSFAPDDVERVRTRALAVLSERESSPDSLLGRLQAQVIYAGHQYQNDPAGTMASVRALTIDDLRRSHARMLQTSRLLIVVVGDLDAAVLKPKVEAVFGAMARGTFEPSPPPALAFTAPTIQVTGRDLPTNFVQGAYAAPAPGSPDYDAMRVATSFLEQRVFEEVRVRRSLSYSPDAFLEDQRANIGGISFSSVDPNRTVGIMLDEIARLQNTLVSAGEIQAIAQQFLTRQYLREESSAAQAGVLAQAEIVGGGWRGAADTLQRIREVTPADVRRVASTYMKNLQFVAVGSPGAIDPRAFTRPR